MPFTYCFDPTTKDAQSKVRGVGRYLQILKENFPDWHFTYDLSSIIHYPSSIFINPFFNFLQPPLTLKRVAQKQIAVIHDLIPLKYPSHFPIGLKGKLNVFFNKIALKNYDLIVTDSQASKRDITKILGVNEAKIRVIYPCLPKIFINSKPQKSAIKQTPNSFCLYVGDATWNKNLVNLARAIKEINVTCVFVGKVFEKKSSSTSEALAKDGWQKELKQFLNETKNDKRFISAGFVPDSELIKLYQQANCNILSSRDEGFGFSYVEAASQACPSILSDIPVLHEISSDQGCLFSNKNDVSALANSIGELYFRKDRREYLAFKAQERSKHFNSEGFRHDFLSIL